MIRTFGSILSLGALSLISLGFAALPAFSQSAPKAETAEEAKFVQQVFELTNRERNKAGLPPLRLLETLCTAAHWMAQDMAAQNYFDHTDRKGRDVAERLQNFGYRGYQAIGENIAAGQTTPEKVVAGWMQSPGHRRNILSPDFSEIGVGYVYAPDSRLKRYWVQDFGSRFHVFPVVINNGEKQTTNPTVKLYLYGEKWATRMRLSNDGVRWTDWQPFRANTEWKLEPGSGKRTVYVELMKSVETRQAIASILLTQSTLPQTSSSSRIP